MSVVPLLKKDYQSKDKTFPIYVRVQHGGKKRYLPTGYRVLETQFDHKVIKHPKQAIINGKIAAIVAQAEKYLADCEVHNRSVNLDFIGTSNTSYSFIDYLQHRADQYRAKEMIIMRRKVERCVKEWKACFKRNVFFDQVNNDLLIAYDSWLIKERKNCNNTRHKKFKFLRESFDQALADGKAQGRNPFKSYHIPTDPVKKDKLSLSELHAIENLQLVKGPVNDARNLFLFSYYAKGTRFEKCATLLRSQIRDGRIFIQANKGKKHISVKIHSKLKGILDQYPKGNIVFPFLKEIPKDKEAYLRAVDSSNTIVNRDLKIVAALAEINTNLTVHIARHSFAYHLKHTSASIHIIQDSLGHSAQSTTEIYLKSLGDEVLDKEMDKLYGR